MHISRHEKYLSAQAESFRAYQLKAKAWSILIQFFSPQENRFYSSSLLEYSHSGMRDTAPITNLDIAEHKRLSTLFRHLRIGIKLRTFAYA